MACSSFAGPALVDRARFPCIQKCRERVNRLVSLLHLVSDINPGCPSCATRQSLAAAVISHLLRNVPIRAVAIAAPALNIRSEDCPFPSRAYTFYLYMVHGNGDQ